MTTLRADVAVVGAGPAGSACALRLAQAGVQTLLIEYKQFPRTKGCGEYVNAPAVESLRALGAGEQLRAHAMPLRGMRLFAHGEAHTFPFHREIWSLPRAQLDDVLRAQAIAQGVRHVRARASAVREEEDGVTILAHDAQGGELRVAARYAIAADGSHTVMAARNGSARARERQRFAIGGHYADRNPLDGWIEMYRDGNRYLALNPLAKDRMNAMCVVPADELREWSGAADSGMRAFAIELSGGRRVLEAADRFGERVSIGPLDTYERCPVARRVLLAGDAAAFFDPFTGQGVAFALKTGELAAQAVTAALAEGSTLPFARYARAVSALMRKRRNVTRLVDAMLHQPLLAHVAARRLHASPFLTRSLVRLVAG